MPEPLTTTTAPLRGEQQLQIMTVAWRVGQATVEQIRNALPDADRPSYNTVQTLLNRLAERELVQRDPHGGRILYAPIVSEHEYLAQAIQHTMRNASPGARKAALARLIERHMP